MSKELIRLSNCVMTFDEDIVLDKINLSIKDKEFLTLLGPSGCGKTTTLRIIGGFQTPTAGDVLFDGVRINSVPPHKRTINTVFQKYALFPHLNVYENIAFGLRIPKSDGSGRKVKLPEEEIDQRVNEMLEVVNLKGYGRRRVTQLARRINSLDMYPPPFRFILPCQLPRFIHRSNRLSRIARYTIAGYAPLVNAFRQNFWRFSCKRYPYLRHTKRLPL